MRRLLILCVLAAPQLLASAASAANLVNLLVTDNFNPHQYVWDTDPGAPAKLFLKAGPTFLYESSGPLSVDLSAPGVYDFDFRLNNTGPLVLVKYDFTLRFANPPDPAVLAIGVIGPTDSLNDLPPDRLPHVTLGDTVVSLNSFGLWRPNMLDEVGATSVGPDGNADYVGTFRLTVSGVPEPAGAVIVLMTAALALIVRRPLPRPAATPVAARR